MSAPHVANSAINARPVPFSSARKHDKYGMSPPQYAAPKTTSAALVIDRSIGSGRMSTAEKINKVPSGRRTSYGTVGPSPTVLSDTTVAKMKPMTFR